MQPRVRRQAAGAAHAARPAGRFRRLSVAARTAQHRRARGAVRLAAAGGLRQQPGPHQCAGRQLTGLVWRLQTDDGNATALRPFGDDILVNLSAGRIRVAAPLCVQSAHAAFVKRRREFFERPVDSIVVLWWVPRGHCRIRPKRANDSIGCGARSGRSCIRVPQDLPGAVLAPGERRALDARVTGVGEPRLSAAACRDAARR